MAEMKGKTVRLTSKIKFCFRRFIVRNIHKILIDKFKGENGVKSLFRRINLAYQGPLFDFSLNALHAYKIYTVKNELRNVFFAMK